MAPLSHVHRPWRDTATSPPVPLLPVMPLISGHFVPVIGRWPFSAHTLRYAVRSCVHSAARSASCFFSRSASRSFPFHPILPLIPAAVMPSGVSVVLSALLPAPPSLQGNSFSRFSLMPPPPSSALSPLLVAIFAAFSASRSTALTIGL